jgi:diguanylate cyclase (GGDEF)-like protein/PAS domain S-box-containing protein
MLRSVGHAATAAATLALLAASFLAPSKPLTVAAFTAGIGLAAGLGVLLGLRLHRPADRRPWLLLAAAALAVGLGGAVRTAVAYRGVPSPPFSVRDAAAVVAYPLLGAALFSFSRRRTARRDWAGTIDAAVITVGVAVATWVFVLIPLWDRNPRLTVAHAVALAHPVALVVLVALGVRFLFTDGPGERSYVFLAGGAALLVVSDMADSVGALQGWFSTGTVLNRFGLLAIASVGAAALDASMLRLSEPLDEPDRGISRRRLAFLAVAAPVAPALVAARALDVTSSGTVVAVVGAVGVAVLAVARAMALARGYENALQLEHQLREGSPRLVVARTREEIASVTTQLAAELVGGAREAFVDFTLGGTPPTDVRDVLVLGGGETGSWLRGEYRRAGLLGRVGSARTLVFPVIVGDRPAGILRIAARRSPSTALRDALLALVTEVAAALEGADRADDMLERRSEARFRSLVQNSKDLIAVVEPDLTIRFVTPSADPMLGFGPDELVGTRLDQLFHPDEAERVTALLHEHARNAGGGELEFQLRQRDGSWRTVEGAVANLLDDLSVRGLVLTAHDVTERRQLEIELARQAFHDSLTGLPNRALFIDRVAHSLERLGRTTRSVAVLFIDIDDFKTVNDSLGHATGDELLVAVGGRLRGCLRSADTGARLGGDEFGVLLEDVGGVGAAIEVAERILEALRRPIVLSEAELLVRASIGIVVGRTGQSSGDLLRNADVAMYKGKRHGGNRYEVFEPAMHAAALARLELKADLERALAGGEFHLMYQPIVELGDGTVVGVEALARWTHPTRGAISPVEFIPLAEETGLIPEIGRWALGQACEQAVVWQQSLLAGRRLSMSVNLAGRQLQSSTLIGDVTDVLARTGINPHDLMLEITESTLMDEVDLVATRLGELKRLGVRIAVDDFGTGFSSLSYLQRFPVDVLKIAKEFVDEIATEQRDVRLVEAVIKIAGSLDLRTVAEGIELEEQRVRLRELGCMLGQGYLFARPMLPEAVPELLAGQLRSVA